MKIRVKQVIDGSTKYRMLFHWCPACEHCHGVRIDDGTPTTLPKWAWDGNRDAPTISPSVLNYTTVSDEDDDDGRPIKLPPGQKRTLCHYFLQAGIIEFCGDNPHQFNGQRVPLPDIPENYFIGGDDV